jgi:hypothetical protein
MTAAVPTVSSATTASESVVKATPERRRALVAFRNVLTPAAILNS